ncbi:MAG: creatininase family protein [Vicinamibacterales bacterium]
MTMKVPECAALAALSLTLSAGSTASAQETPPQPRQATASVNLQPRRDVESMPRPIDLHDSVWIEELTMLEVRDLIKAGKTTALVLTGGIEENGPYLTTGKHNNVLKATGEAIARGLGNALVAPIVTLEPGNPARPHLSPGTIFLSVPTYKAVLTDMATSLRSQGFSDIVMLGDSGGNLAPMKDVATALNTAWAGEGARVHFIPEYYNYADVEKFEQEVLGVHETLEGLHDDYYISAIIMTVDLDGVRMKERMKANAFVINGVPLAPVEKTVEHGRRMVAFRTDVTVAAIKKSMAASKAP